MKKRFVLNKTAIIITVLVVIYGLSSLYTKSNGWDFSKNGISYFLGEMQPYFAAIGAVWITFLISIDRAKKEIEKEQVFLFEKKLKKWGSILIADGQQFIAETLLNTMKRDFSRKHLPKILKEDIPGKMKYVNTFYLNVGQLEKLMDDYETKTNNTIKLALKDKL